MINENHLAILFLLSPLWGYLLYHVYKAYYFLIANRDIAEEVDFELRLRNGMGTRQFAVESYNEGIPLWVKITAVIVIYLLIEDDIEMPGLVTGLFAALLALAWYFAPINQHLKSIVVQRHAERKKAAADAKFNANFEDIEDENFAGDQTNGDYGFDDRAFNGGEDPTPRGFDKRHPDDVKFWAFVDDPSASDQERKSAFEMILKRQARREGRDTKRGLRDIVSRN